jgi:hypothetical protein
MSSTVKIVNKTGRSFYDDCFESDVVMRFTLSNNDDIVHVGLSARLNCFESDGCDAIENNRYASNTMMCCSIVDLSARLIVTSKAAVLLFLSTTIASRVPLGRTL